MARADAHSVLHESALARERENRAAGTDAEDYALADLLRDELREKLGVETRSFQDLCHLTIADDACIPILAAYLPRFRNVGFAQNLVTQQFWRKGNADCADFLESWIQQLRAEGRLSKPVEETIDNALARIQDKRKVPFYLDLIRPADAFYLTMRMLARWQVEDALPIICDRLGKDRIPTNAIASLAAFGDASLVPLVRPFLNSGQAGPREATRKAIARMEQARARN